MVERKGFECTECGAQWVAEPVVDGLGRTLMAVCDGEMPEVGMPVESALCFWCALRVLWLDYHASTVVRTAPGGLGMEKERPRQAEGARMGGSVGTIGATRDRGLRWARIGARVVAVVREGDGAWYGLDAAGRFTDPVPGGLVLYATVREAYAAGRAS